MLGRDSQDGEKLGLRRFWRLTLAPSPVLMEMAPDEGTNVDAFELSPIPFPTLPLDETEPFPTVTTVPERVEREECAVEGRSRSSSTWSVCTYGASSFHESSSTRAGVGSIVPSSR